VLRRFSAALANLEPAPDGAQGQVTKASAGPMLEVGVEMTSLAAPLQIWFPSESDVVETYDFAMGAIAAGWSLADDPSETEAVKERGRQIAEDALGAYAAAARSYLDADR
jgi:hypothetical protein